MHTQVCFSYHSGFKLFCVAIQCLAQVTKIITTIIVVVQTDF